MLGRALGLAAKSRPCQAANGDRLFKAGFRRSFDGHECSGTASQVTPQGRHQHVNAWVGFELATDGIQFYVFAN